MPDARGCRNPPTAFLAPSHQAALELLAHTPVPIHLVICVLWGDDTYEFAASLTSEQFPNLRGVGRTSHPPLLPTVAIPPGRTPHAAAHTSAHTETPHAIHAGASQRASLALSSRSPRRCRDGRSLGSETP
jgi:hypothetical protein